MAFLNRNGAQGTFDALLASNPASPAPAMSVAHLAATVGSELSHVQTHLDHAVTGSSPESMAFDVAHAHHHAGIAAEHHNRLLQHIAERDPEVGGELDKLRQATPGDGSFVPADDIEAMVQP